MKSFDQYFSDLASAICNVDYNTIEQAYLVARSCHTLYIFGNGGSAAIANHWVCDYAKGINEDTVRNATAISLSSNVPLITAIANDLGYEHIFSKQLSYMSPSTEDAVFAISSSGNSKNVINGLEKAKELGLKTVALTGFDGGLASKIADVSVHIPAHNYGIVEDTHMMILHSISQRIRYSMSISPEKLKL